MSHVINNPKFIVFIRRKGRDRYIAAWRKRANTSDTYKLIFSTSGPLNKRSVQAKTARLHEFLSPSEMQIFSTERYHLDTLDEVRNMIEENWTALL